MDVTVETLKEELRKLSLQIEELNNENKHLRKQNQTLKGVIMSNPSFIKGENNWLRKAILPSIIVDQQGIVQNCSDEFTEMYVSWIELNSNDEEVANDLLSKLRGKSLLDWSPSLIELDQMARLVLEQKQPIQKDVLINMASDQKWYSVKMTLISLGKETFRFLRDSTYIPEDISSPSQNINTFTDEDDSDSCVLITFYDITTYKQQIKQLDHELHLIESIYLNAPTPLCFLDKNTFRYVRVNRLLAKENGIPVESHYTKTVVDIAPPVIPFVESVMATRKPLLDVEVSVAVDPIRQSYNTYLCSFQPIFDDDNPDDIVGIACAVKNVTSFIDQAKNLQNATNQKSRFISNVSHEIRTPLTCIAGLVDFLLESPLNPEQLDHVLSIRTSADNLLTLLNDILDLSKVEAGKMSISMSSFDLLTELETIINILSFKLWQKKIALCLKFDLNMHRQYVGDRNRIRQIIMNLVGNSMKFTSEGHIILEVVEIPSTTVGKYGIRMNVIDTGVGIPEELVSKVFQEFEQASEHQNGSGLGLCICKQLAKMMGGDVQLIKTAVNQGSHFAFELELQPDLTVNKPIPERISFQSMKPIAIYSPNDILQEILRNSLAYCLVPEEMQVVPLTNPACLNDIIIDDYSMIIADVSSSIQDVNFEAFKRKFYERPTTQIPIIAILSLDRRKALTDVVNGSPTNDAVDFLTMPIVPSTTLECIRKAVQRARFPEKFLNENISSRRVNLPMNSLGNTSSNNNPISPSSSDEGQFSHLRVLLVEDNQINQKIFLRLFSKLKCQVELANNGKEAVQMYSSTNSYNIIFMDCQMPIMNGYEATRQIRIMEKATGNHIPIVAITAHAMSTDRALCMECGMDDYLTKPLDAVQVASVLKGLCVQNRSQ